jgi:hypothetical protein
MAFCPICRCSHDPRYPCYDRTEEMLHKIGIDKHSQLSQKEFRIIEKRADRDMLMIAIGVLLFIAALVVFVAR